MCYDPLRFSLSFSDLFTHTHKHTHTHTDTQTHRQIWASNLNVQVWASNLNVQVWASNLNVQVWAWQVLACLVQMVCEYIFTQGKIHFIVGLLVLTQDMRLRRACWSQKKRHTGRHTHADRHTQTHYVERRRCFLIESRYKHNTDVHTHTHTETHKHTRRQTHANPLCPAPPVFFNGACFKVCVGV